MRLSLRLLALGVSGPLVGLGMFLAISAGTVMQLSRKANLEMTELFNQDNLQVLSLMHLNEPELLYNLSHTCKLVTLRVNQNLPFDDLGLYVLIRGNLKVKIGRAHV